MAKKPDSSPKGDSAESAEGAETPPPDTSRPAPDVQLAWAQIISTASQDANYAQSAFADLASAFKDIGIEDISGVDMDKDLVPALPDAQRMVTGALNLKAQEQAAQGMVAYGYSYGTYAAAPADQGSQSAQTAVDTAESPDQGDASQDSSDQSDFQGGPQMYTDQSGTTATYMGGCVGSFGTAG